MPTYVWYSPSLDESVEMHVPMADRDVPPNLPPHDWLRPIQAPNFTRRSYLDGQRKDLTDFKKIAKLGQQAAELPQGHPDRNLVDAEIKARKKAGKKVTKGA